MHPYKRTERLNILLREEIADLIMKKIKDPRLGFVTVTDVELTKDLRTAKVFISIMNKNDYDLSLEILNSSKGLLRSEISKRIKIKYIPSIEFLIDRSAEHGGRIDEILRGLRESRQKDDTTSQ
ncbi:MAG: 30S ribosome-binding factor RbfA [Thermodesulfovibrionales bacterium]|nr:30S ribosome-binding factor RbfA [Thermodesulfovibrionales bacterium]